MNAIVEPTTENEVEPTLNDLSFDALNAKYRAANNRLDKLIETINAKEVIVSEARGKITEMMNDEKTDYVALKGQATKADVAAKALVAARKGEEEVRAELKEIKAAMREKLAEDE